MNTACNTLIELICQKNPVQMKYLRESVRLLSPDDIHEFERYLHFAESEGYGLEFLAEAYLWFCNMVLEETIFFRRNGRYRFATGAEAQAHVYSDRPLMTRYMFGLGLSAFIWQQHHQIRQFFIDALPAEKRPGTYLEVGPGHGFFFVQALHRQLWDRYLGVDISPESVRLSSRVVQSGIWGNFQNWQIMEQDFLALPEDAKFQALVVGEVLEHVEKPQDFIRKIARLSAPDAWIFASTCLNAPAIDHICNFSSVDEIIGMFTACGICVVDKLIYVNRGLPLLEAYAKKETVLVALVGKPA